MPCNRPIDAYYANELTDLGKRGLTFNPKRRYVGSDLRYTAPLKVPCTKCLGCKADQSLMWSIRAYHESLMHDQNCFVTLTYDNENLPANGKIDKTHLQKFFKRVRKKHSIRYFACGEYGGQTHRPHYHAIIFGKDWLEGSQQIDDKLYTNHELVSMWGQGLVSIAPVTMASICYVCGYVTKKLDDTDTFTLMSRRRGIGYNFLDKYKTSLAQSESVTIEGREYPIPKRYLAWEEESKLFDHVKNNRRSYAKQKAGEDPMDRSRIERSREFNQKTKVRLRTEKI